jgi:rhamnogalacturonan endolyase
VRTADGTGVAIPDTDDDGKTDDVNASGYILEGPEFLSIFDGRTGRELARTPYLGAVGFPTGATTTATASTDS